MEEHIDAEKVMKSQIIEHFQIEKYIFIRRCVDDRGFDVSQDEVFQKAYDGFWNLRRNKNWRKIYFAFFQKIRESIANGEKTPEFVTVLENVNRINEMLGGTYSFEPSFSSKLLATIDPDMPVWDSRVLEKLGYKKDWEDDKSVENAEAIYKRICEWYEAYLNTPEARQNIEIFNAYLPEYTDISQVKKIDYLLWGSVKDTEPEDNANEQDHLISIRVEDDKTYYTIGTSSKEHEIVFDDVINRWIRESFYLLEHIAGERKRRNIEIVRSAESAKSGGEDNVQESFGSAVDEDDVQPKDRFFGLAETVTEQFLYYLITNELSYSDNNQNLNFLSYHIVYGGVKLSGDPIVRKAQEVWGEKYYNHIQSFLARLIMMEFNTFHQAFFYDFYIGFWSGFESCINGICAEYENEIQDRCNDSQIKNLKKLLKSMYKDKGFCDEMLDCFDDDIAIKRFKKYVSFNDRRDYLFDVVIKDSYSRDKKEDRAIIDFCAAFRNTMHNNGTHQKKEKQLSIRGKVFVLPEKGKMYNDQFSDVFILLQELFDIYLEIYDGLVAAKEITLPKMESEACV